jgi:hypothetical protein
MYHDREVYHLEPPHGQPSSAIAWSPFGSLWWSQTPLCLGAPFSLTTRFDASHSNDVVLPYLLPSSSFSFCSRAMSERDLMAMSFGLHRISAKLPFSL